MEWTDWQTGRLLLILVGGQMSELVDGLFADKLVDCWVDWSAGKWVNYWVD